MSAGVYLCRDDFEASFFVRMNNTGGPVDVWAVTGVGEDELVEGDSGFCYFPFRVPPAQVAPTDWPRDEPAIVASGQQRKKKGKKKPRAGK
jgi:hypothetical protein